MSGAFSPSSFRPGGMRELTVSKLSPPPNTIEPFRSALTAVLVFPLIPKPARCLQRVRLRLRVLGGQGTRAELALLYRTWAGGVEFPSAGKRVRPGTPLVVSIRPPGWTNEDDFVREFAGAAAGRAAPSLAWTASGGCRTER